MLILFFFIQGNGICLSSNLCKCNTDWTDLDCSAPSCSNQNYSSGNGQCIGFNLCQCSPNWSGDSCNLADCSSLNNCSKTGKCVQPNVCECSLGYTGSDCSQLSSNCSSVLNNCNQHGVCINATCRCFTGYSGLKCELTACDRVQNCSGNGICNEPNICACNAGYGGQFCETPTCPALNSCSYSNGVCNANQTCSCNQGYSGADCSQFDCAQVSNCSNVGVCIASNVCSCNKDYDGSSCQILLGPNSYTPQFTNFSYSVTCDEHLALGSFIVNTYATDSDPARNGLVKYLIQPIFDFQFFAIDSNSGNITLSNYLINALSDALTVRVQAYDQGIPRKGTTTDVGIAVKRVVLPNMCNDILNMTVSSVQFSINDAASQNITLPLRPISLDTVSRNVAYSLGNTNTNGVIQYVTINSSTGILSISNSIKLGLYQVYVTATETYANNTTPCNKQLTLSLLVNPKTTPANTTTTASTSTLTKTTVTSTLTTTFTQSSTKTTVATSQTSTTYQSLFSTTKSSVNSAAKIESEIWIVLKCFVFIWLNFK